MKNLFVILICTILLGSCAKQAYVNLENAPVGDSNINSRRVGFGDVFLLDMNSKTFNYRGNLLEVDQEDRLDVITASKGNYTQSASNKIGITFAGNIGDIKPKATASIASSLVFSLQNHTQKRFRFPDDVLNAKEVVSFRAKQAPYANSRFKFLFVNEVFSGKKIEYKFNGQKDDGGKVSIDVAGQKIEVNFNNGSSVVCEGDDNACIVSVQIWQLVRDSSGATGYKFILDTQKEAKVVFQKGV